MFAELLYDDVGLRGPDNNWIDVGLVGLSSELPSAVAVEVVTADEDDVVVGD